MAPSNPSNLGSTYENFAVAVYTRAYEVREMADPDKLQTAFDKISRYLKVDKVYLETHRDTLMPDATTIEGAKGFFAERGIETAGGITYTINERNLFETYCYTRPEQRQKVREIAEYTARFFDEFILDDFFFTSCKCPACIEAKGNRSWTDYRLALMAEAARTLVLEPAHAVNPNVKVVIKYPNWYEHFHGLGFNLELQPQLFDGIYTGTETRDPVLSNQHLQPYHGYSIIRYFENLKPGGNGGGWVDPFGSQYVDRYAEQLWLTVFAKAREVTLFDWGQVQRALSPEQRAPWQGSANRVGIGVDFDTMVAPTEREDGSWNENATVALAAAHAFEKVDPVLGALGEPVGIPSYRPFHASGEDFLHSYLGMLGLPIELLPEFPNNAGTLLLTEAAKRDPLVASKIKQHLLAGNNVVVTSGLYRALQGQASEADDRIEDIVEVEVTEQKALVGNYLMGWRERAKGEANAQILVPHLRYLTNDSWELVSGLTATTGHPILLDAKYAGAHFYVLTIPDNFDDLYKLPREVLGRIRMVLAHNLPIRLDAPGQVMFFLYDNDTCVVESFLDEPVDVALVIRGDAPSVADLTSGETLTGQSLQDWLGQPTGEVRFETEVGPHAFRVFRFAQSD
jgi:hypothetical protein